MSEYYEMCLDAEEKLKDKHLRLVETLAELLAMKTKLRTLEWYVEQLENYTDGLESITPVDHKQRRPRNPIVKYNE